MTTARGDFPGAQWLPNTPDGPTVSGLAAGDTASVGKLRYVCLDASSKAAKWAQLEHRSGPARVYGHPIALNAANLTAVGTDAAADASTSCYVVEFDLPHTKVVSTVGVLNGTTVGTDNIRCAIYDEDGTFLIGSATAGVLGAGADVFQAVSMTESVTLPAGKYWVGLKVSGTTHQNQRLSAGSPMRNAARLTGHTFAGNADITPPTTFTADTGPIVYLA